MSKLEPHDDVKAQMLIRDLEKMVTVLKECGNFCSLNAFHRKLTEEKRFPISKEPFLDRVHLLEHFEVIKVEPLRKSSKVSLENNWEEKWNQLKANPQELISGAKITTLPYFKETLQSSREYKEEEVALTLRELKIPSIIFEVRDTLMAELRSILESDYWDIKLEKLFMKALRNPEKNQAELGMLISVAKSSLEEKGTLKLVKFLAQHKKKVFNLVFYKIPGSLYVYIKVAENNEILRSIRKGLHKDGQVVAGELRFTSQVLYQKVGFEAKKLLIVLCHHEDSNVRGYANVALRAIQNYS